MGLQARQITRRYDAVLAFDLLALFLMTMGNGFATEVPLPRQRGIQIPGPFADPLPLSLAARTLFAALQPAPYLALWMALFLTITKDAVAVVVVVPLWSAAGLCGIALGKWTRTLLAGFRMARLGWIGMLLLLGGIYLAYLAPLLSKTDVRVPGLETCGRALLARDFWVLGVVAAFALVLGGLAWAAVRAAERVSFDRLDPLTGGRIERRSSAAKLDVARVEAVLRKREPGRWLTTLYLCILLLAGAAFVIVRQFDASSDKAIDAASPLFGIMIAQFGFILGTARAHRSIARDVAARPLLGSLPMAPRDTLSGKTRQLRLQLVPLALPLFLVLASARHPLATSLVWRAPIAAAALALYAEAAIAVAFLSSGLGAQTPRQAMVSLDAFLVAGPFLGALLSRNPAQALLSLACLAALTFEARRSAKRALSWVDDPEQTTETPTWRALLVLAGFQATQALTASLLALFLRADVAAGGAYAAAAAALVLLTLQGRPVPEGAHVRPAYLLVGAFSGLLTGGAAIGYLAWLRRCGFVIETPAIPLALAVVAVAAAPIAEELFFRGWLQRSIASELPAARARWAPVITALAFAAIHPAISFAPVLVLGLATGALYARTKTVHAGVFAHLAHNSVAVMAPLLVGS
jgi:membrane protease YdiL (CAAX protease family)